MALTESEELELLELEEQEALASRKNIAIQEEKPNINPTGKTVQVPNAYQNRLQNSLYSPQMDKFMAALGQSTPFGARIASAVSGMPVEDVKMALSEMVKPQQDETFGESFAGVGGMLTGALPTTLGAGGALGLGAKTLGASGQLANVIANIGAGGLYGAGRASAQGENPIVGGATGLAFGAAGAAGAKLGAQLLPAWVPGAERIGSAAGGAAVDYLGSKLMGQNNQDAAANMLMGAISNTAFPMARKANIGALEQLFRQQKAAQRTLSDLRIIKGRKQESGKSYKQRQIDASDAMIDIYNNRNVDQSGETIVPKSYSELIDLANKAETKKWNELREIEKIAEINNERGYGKRKVRFKVDPVDIVKEIKSLQKDIDTRTAMNKDPKIARNIKTLIDVIESKYKNGLDSVQVDSWLKDANSKVKNLHGVPNAERYAIPENVVATAIRKSHIKLLNSLDTSGAAGKTWAQKRREIGKIMALKESLPKEDGTVHFELGDNIISKGSKWWNRALLVKDAATGNPSAIGRAAQEIASYKNKTVSDKISRMFSEMEKAENMRTLNQRISDTITKDKVDKATAKVLDSLSVGLSVKDQSDFFGKTAQ